MGASCLFLAAKVEEQPRKLEHVIRVFQMLINKESSSTPPIDTKSKVFIKHTLALWCGPRITSLPLPRYVVRGD